MKRKGDEQDLPMAISAIRFGVDKARLGLTSNTLCSPKQKTVNDCSLLLDVGYVTSWHLFMTWFLTGF